MPINQFAQSVLALSRARKRLAVVAIDTVLSLVSVWVAFYLRIEQTGFPEHEQLYVYLIAPLLAVPIFIVPSSAIRVWRPC